VGVCEPEEAYCSTFPLIKKHHEPRPRGRGGNLRTFCCFLQPSTKYFIPLQWHVPMLLWHGSKERLLGWETEGPTFTSWWIITSMLSRISPGPGCPHCAVKWLCGCMILFCVSTHLLLYTLYLS